MYFATSLLLFSALSGASVYAQQRCNGFEELCDRGLGNVTFIGAHNSYADLEAEGQTVGAGASSNQYNNVTRQLADGIRMLQGQGHPSPGDDSSVQLCHTNCALLDGGSLTSYLEKVKTFLESNPDEVLIFLWVNSEDGPPLSAWADSYRESGMEDYAYVPPQTPVRNTEWPTLAELISSGKRTVSFIDTGAEDSVPYLLDQFDYIFETPADPADDDFPCTLTRPEGASPDGLMYLLNQNLNTQISSTISLPANFKANTTNAACGEHTMEQSVDNCIALYNRNPNIILLDYYNYPARQPFQVGDYLNRVGPDPCDAGGNYIGNITTTTSSAPTATSGNSDQSGTASVTSSGDASASSTGAAAPVGSVSSLTLLAALAVVIGTS